MSIADLVTAKVAVGVWNVGVNVGMAVDDGGAEGVLVAVVEAVRVALLVGEGVWIFVGI